MEPKASTAVAMMPPRRLEIAHRVVVGHGAAARRLDLPADLRGGILLGALTTEGDADVVHHHLGPLRGETEGDVPPDAPPRTRHHRRPTVEKSHGRRQYLAAVL